MVSSMNMLYIRGTLSIAYVRDSEHMLTFPITALWEVGKNKDIKISLNHAGTGRSGIIIIKNPKTLEEWGLAFGKRNKQQSCQVTQEFCKRTKGMVYKAIGACVKYNNKGRELKLRKGHLQRKCWKKCFTQKIVTMENKPLWQPLQQVI